VQVGDIENVIKVHIGSGRAQEPDQELNNDFSAKQEREAEQFRVVEATFETVVIKWAIPEEDQTSIECLGSFVPQETLDQAFAAARASRIKKKNTTSALKQTRKAFQSNEPKVSTPRRISCNGWKRKGAR